MTQLSLLTRPELAQVQVQRPRKLSAARTSS